MPIANNIMLALSALTSALPAYERAQANERRYRDLQRGLREQRSHQAGANKEVQDLIDQRAQSDSEDEKAQAMTQYLTQLRHSRQARSEATPQVLGASDRYASDVAGARAENRQYGESMAGLLARINAPQYQRIEENQNTHQTAEALDRIGRKAQSDDYLSRLRASMERTNPWVDAVAKVGYQIANNYQPLTKEEKLQHLIDKLTVPGGKHVDVPTPKGFGQPLGMGQSGGTRYA